MAIGARAGLVPVITMKLQGREQGTAAFLQTMMPPKRPACGRRRLPVRFRWRDQPRRADHIPDGPRMVDAITCSSDLKIPLCARRS